MVVAHQCSLGVEPCRAYASNTPGWSNLSPAQQRDIKSVLGYDEHELWIKIWFTGNSLFMMFDGWLSYTLVGAGTIDHAMLLAETTEAKAEHRLGFDEYDLRLLEAFFDPTIGIPFLESVTVRAINAVQLTSSHIRNWHVLTRSVDILSTRLGWAFHTVGAKAADEDSADRMSPQFGFTQIAGSLYSRRAQLGYDPGNTFLGELVASDMLPHVPLTGAERRFTSRNA